MIKMAFAQVVKISARKPAMLAVARNGFRQLRVKPSFSGIYGSLNCVPIIEINHIESITLGYDILPCSILVSSDFREATRDFHDSGNS